MVFKKKESNPFDIDIFAEKELHKIPKIEGIKEAKEGTIKLHYVVGNAVCGLIVLAFIIMIFACDDVPEYMIGLVGSIVGYYIARAPYDL
jgi:hypothetical protein